MSCLETLKEKGFKLTPQRRLIVNIIDDADTHLNAEEIIAYVQARMPGVNKSTIYRTMDLLEGAGCVYKSELENQFIYHHADEGQHHHLVCNNCGKTIDCDKELFSSVERALEKKYRFHANLKHMVINGLCKECKNKPG